MSDKPETLSESSPSQEEELNLARYDYLAVVILAISVLMVFQPMRTLLFGWVWFLSRVAPNITPNWMLVGIGIASWAGTVVLIHHLCSWLAKSRNSISGHQGVWMFRSSLSLSLLIVVMFCAGLAAVGITHQTAWIIRSDDDLMVQKIGTSSSVSDDTIIEYELELIHHGLGNYISAYKKTPFIAASDGEVPQSWPSRLVWTMHYISNRDGGSTLPWDHKSNHDYYSRVFPELLSPALENAPQHNGLGYGLSHFEANENVKVFSVSQFQQGTSNVAIIGEVRSNFQPWGKPETHRNLNLGLNKHPNGFGGPPSRDSVMFLMADGSVRHVNQTIDPEVLRALSGEQPPDSP